MWMALERFWIHCEGQACPRPLIKWCAMPPSGCLTTNFLTVRVRVCACMMPCISGAFVSMWLSLCVMRRREGQRPRRRTRSNRIVASLVRGVRGRRQARLLRQDPLDVGMHASAARSRFQGESGQRPPLAGLHSSRLVVCVVCIATQASCLTASASGRFTLRRS